jgi:hypothetical protein
LGYREVSRTSAACYEKVAMSGNCSEDSSTFDEFQLPYQVVFEGDDEVEADDGTRYTRTPTEEWTRVDIEDGQDHGERTIDLIEWTGEEADKVDITDEELTAFML